MTDVLKAILLGVLEGLTEFIPVSSTGHLILAGNALEFSTANVATFSISIQLGAILAVVYLYWDFFKEFLSPSKWLSKDMLHIIVAIFPALILGFFLHSTIKDVLFTPFNVALALVAGGLVMLVIDQLPHKEDVSGIENITLRQALVIGLFQCVALWPGTSRSGSTIIGGLFSKLSYETSAKFSFIIAVPVMIAATTYDFYKSYDALTFQDLYLIAIGFVTSFIVSVFAIVWFISVLNKYRFFPFALYRILLGILVLLLI